MPRTGIQGGGGGGSVTLTGQAVGGDLSGNWPNLSYGTGSIVDADVSNSAAIARTKSAAVETRRVLGAGGQPTLAAGWSQFEPVSFWLDPLTEHVEFQGILLRTGSYTSGTTIFTLPTGYRPAGAVNRQLFAHKIVSAFTITPFTITPSGPVFVSEDLATASYIYLDGQRFRI